MKSKHEMSMKRSVPSGILFFLQLDFSKYWKRIVYRAGLRYSDVGLNINNQNINEFGINFGVGLPLGGTFSNANIGFEFGERGTTTADLIKEKYFNIHLSLSLNSRWFQKRKYN